MDPGALGRTLEDRRRTLQVELDALTAIPRDPMAAVSFGKRIGDGTTEAVDRLNKVGAANAIASTLADVERALEKLADGTLRAVRPLRGGDHSGTPGSDPVGAALHPVRAGAVSTRRDVCVQVARARDVRACETMRRMSPGVSRAAPFVSSQAKISGRMPNAVTLTTSPGAAAASIDRSPTSSSS